MIMVEKYMIKLSNYFQHKIVIGFSRNLIATLPENKDMSRSRKLIQLCDFICSQAQSTYFNIERYFQIYVLNVIYPAAKFGKNPQHRS